MEADFLDIEDIKSGEKTRLTLERLGDYLK